MDDLAVELTAELELIAERADAARRALAEGRALNGVTALVTIHDRASDAARHARHVLEGTPAIA